MNFLFKSIRVRPNDSTASRIFTQGRIKSRRFQPSARRAVCLSIACFCFLSTHVAGTFGIFSSAGAAQTHHDAHDEDTDDGDASSRMPDEESIEETPSDNRDEDSQLIAPSKDTKRAAPALKQAIPPQSSSNRNARVAANEAEIGEAELEVEAAARAGESLRETASRLKLPLPLPLGRIVVLKSRRRLELWNGDTLIKTYGVALGASPQGHKRRRGDKRTPEGEFRICTRNATTSAFHIFLGLDYPAVPDAARALKNKTISWREYQAIRSRLASRSAPPWGTRLGGWVGIHGGNDGAFARKRAKQLGGSDWTAGCIALRDREIEEIYAATRLGTMVSVRP